MCTPPAESNAIFICSNPAANVPRAAEIQPHKPFPALPKPLAIVDRHLRLLQEEVTGRPVDARLPAVQPEQIGGLRVGDTQARQVLLHETHCVVPVGRQVAQQRLQPVVAVGVGRFRCHHAQNVQMGHDPCCRCRQLFAQFRVLDDGETGAQPGDIEGLAWRHEGDGALADLRRQAGDGNVPGAIQEEIAVDLVGADHQVMAAQNSAMANSSARV